LNRTGKKALAMMTTTPITAKALGISAN